MAFGTILVHIDDNEHSWQRLEAAIRLASDSDARLVGIYLAPTLDISPSIAALLPADLILSRQGELGALQHEAEHRFRSATEAAGLARTGWRAPAGPAPDEIVAHGRCADLLLLGQSNRSDKDSDFSKELVVAALLSVGRPLLIIPHVGVATAPGRNILVAWNGSRESARAVADAMPMLERAQQVIVLAADDVDGRGISHSLSNGRLIDWLRDHGIEARLECVSADIDIGEALLSGAADHGADLIVMGGYGHARLREMVLGSVTQTLLRAMTVPLLMSH